MKLQNPISSLFLGGALLLVSVGAVGCTQSNDRTPTKAETQVADTKRQNYIDQTNLPPDVKAQMKSHLGGPPAPNPATQAKPAGSDRKN